MNQEGYKHEMKAYHLMMLYLAAYSRDLERAEDAFRVYKYLAERRRELIPGKEKGVICTQKDVARALKLDTKSTFHSFKTLRDLGLVMKEYVGGSPVYYRVLSPDNTLGVAKLIFLGDILKWS
nr:MAG TPA: CodY-like protein [Caudoviricetes sp.]